MDTMKTYLLILLFFNSTITGPRATEIMNDSEAARILLKLNIEPIKFKKQFKKRCVVVYRKGDDLEETINRFIALRGGIDNLRKDEYTLVICKYCERSTVQTLGHIITHLQRQHRKFASSEDILRKHVCAYAQKYDNYRVIVK